MINILLKKFYTFLCVLISYICSPKYKVFNKLFNFFATKSSDSLYFINYRYKIKIIDYLKRKSLIHEKNLVEKYKSIEVDNNINLVLNDLKNEGISEKINIEIKKDEIDNLIKYLANSNFYSSHVPNKLTKQIPGTKIEGAYKSYDYATQLNNKTIIKLCTNEKIVKIAEQYLGTFPKIYSINTFNTFPGKKAFTHEFHRDIDNLKWVVVFIYWTKTLPNDGAFEQIKFTHRPSESLNNLLKKNPQKFSNNFDTFFKKTVPGYGQNKEYENIFNSEIKNVYGKPGKIVASDTLGLHRGTHVDNERIVTWIRYGVTQSRQKVLKNDETLEKKIKLKDENMKILNNSKFKDVLSDIVELN